MFLPERAAAPFDTSISKRWLIALFVLVALGTRVPILFTQQLWRPDVAETVLLKEDALWYDLQAAQLAKTGSFSQFDDNTFVLIRPPGYQAFIAILYAIFGHRVWVVLAAQILISTAVTLVVYNLTRQLTHAREAKYIAAFLYGICLLSAYYSTRLLSETLFTLLFAIAVLLLIKGFSDRGIRYYLLSGFVLGVATLVRPISQYYPVVIGAALLFHKEKPVLKARNFGLFLVVFLLVISTWQIRNYRTYGYFSLTNQAAHEIGRMHSATLKSKIERIPIAQAKRDLLGDALEGEENPFRRAEISKKIGLAYIKPHWKQYAAYSGRNALSMILGTGRIDIYRAYTGWTRAAETPGDPAVYEGDGRYDVDGNAKFIVLTVFLYLVLAVQFLSAATALVVMVARKQFLFVVFFGGTFLYFFSLPGIQSCARYKLPVLPILIVLAAIGIGNLTELARGRKRRGNVSP